MKSLPITTAFLFSSVLAIAQQGNKDVPATVQAAFQKKFPNAKSVTWEKEGSNFEAEFKSGAIEYSAVLDAKGTLLETETEIKKEQLPAPALKYVSDHYPKEKIKECAKITDAKGIITFEAEVKGSDLIFDSKGQFIKAVNQ